MTVITVIVGEDAPAATAFETALDILKNTWRQFCLLPKELRSLSYLPRELLNFFCDPEHQSLLSVCTGVLISFFWALIWLWSNIALVRWIVAFQLLRNIYQRPEIRFVLIPLSWYLSNMVLRWSEYETGSRDLRPWGMLPELRDISYPLAIIAVLVALKLYFLPGGLLFLDPSIQTEEGQQQEPETETEPVQKEQRTPEEQEELRRNNQEFWFALHRGQRGQRQRTNLRRHNQEIWFALQREEREQRERANFRRPGFEQRTSSPTSGNHHPRYPGPRPRWEDIREDMENTAREPRAAAQTLRIMEAAMGVQVTEGVETPIPAEINTNEPDESSDANESSDSDEAYETPETPSVGNNDTDGTNQRDDTTEETESVTSSDYHKPADGVRVIRNRAVKYVTRGTQTNLVGATGRTQMTLVETEPAQLSLVFYDPVVVDPVESESVPSTPIVPEASVPEPPTLTLVRLASVVIEPVELDAVAPEVIALESSTVTPEVTVPESSTPAPEVTVTESSTPTPSQVTSVVTQPGKSEPVVSVKPTYKSVLEGLAECGAITLNPFSKTSKESGNNSITHGSKERKFPTKPTRRRVSDGWTVRSPLSERRSSGAKATKRSISKRTFSQSAPAEVHEPTSEDPKTKKSLKEISEEIRRAARPIPIIELGEEEDIWSATPRELSPISPLATRSSQPRPTAVPDQRNNTDRVRFEDEFPIIPSIEALEPQPQVDNRPETLTTRDYTTSSAEASLPGIGAHEPLPQGDDGPATSDPRDYSSFEPKPDTDSHDANDDDESDSDDGFPPPAGAVPTWNFDGPLSNKPRNFSPSLSSQSSDHTDSDIDTRLRLPSPSPQPLSPSSSDTFTTLAETLDAVFLRTSLSVVTLPEGTVGTGTASLRLPPPARPEHAPMESRDDAEMKALLENTMVPLGLTPPEKIFENMTNNPVGPGLASPNPFTRAFTLTPSGTTPSNPFATASTTVPPVPAPYSPFTPVATSVGPGSTTPNPFAALSTPVGPRSASYSPFAVVPGSQQSLDIDAALDAILSGTGVVAPSQPNDESMELDDEYETMSMGDEDYQMEDVVTNEVPQNMKDEDGDHAMTDVVPGNKRDREAPDVASNANTDVEMGDVDEVRGAPARVTEDVQMQYEFNLDLATDLEAAFLEDQTMAPAPQPPIAAPYMMPAPPPAPILMPPPPRPAASRPIPPPITIPSFGGQLPNNPLTGTSSANNSSTPVFDYSTINIPNTAQSTPGYRAVTTTELNPRNIFATPTGPSPSINFSDAQFHDFYTGRVIGDRRTLVPRSLRGAASVPASTIAPSSSFPAAPVVNETSSVANSIIWSDPDARASGPVLIPMSAPVTVSVFARAPAPAPVPASTSTDLRDRLLFLGQVMAQETASETAQAQVQEQSQPQPQPHANVEPIPTQTSTVVQPETPRRIIPLPRGRLASFQGENRVSQPSYPARPSTQTPIANVAPIQMDGLMFPGGNQVIHFSPAEATIPSGPSAAELEKAKKAREKAFEKKQAESMEKLKARYERNRKQKPSIFHNPKVKPSPGSKTRDQDLAERERALASPSLFKSHVEAERKKKKEEEEEKRKKEEVVDEAEVINLKRNRDGESSPDPEAKRQKATD